MPWEIILFTALCLNPRGAQSWPSKCPVHPSILPLLCSLVFGELRSPLVSERQKCLPWPRWPLGSGSNPFPQRCWASSSFGQSRCYRGPNFSTLGSFWQQLSSNQSQSPNARPCPWSRIPVRLPWNYHCCERTAERGLLLVAGAARGPPFGTVLRFLSMFHFVLRKAELPRSCLFPAALRKSPSPGLGFPWKRCG